MQTLIACARIASVRSFLGRLRRGGARCALVRDERGQGMLEYAVIGGVIIVGAVAALTALSGALNRVFTSIANTLGQF